MSTTADLNRTFRKGDRVQVLYKGEWLHGSVRSHTRGAYAVNLDEGAGILRNVFGASIKASNRPAPAPKHRFIVGDRAQCHDRKKGVTHVGTVTALRSDRLTLSLDGGIERISGHVSLFEPAPALAPMSSGNPEMDRYAVTGYKEYPKMSEETTAYTATITLDGVVVCGAKNDGQGGCDHFTQLPGSPYSVEDLQLACARWAGEHCVDGETIDLWVDWFVNQRPARVSAVDYLEPIAQGQKEGRRERAEREALPIVTTDTAVGSRFILRESTRSGRLPYEAKIIDTETGIEVAVRPMDIRPTRELLEALFPVGAGECRLTPAELAALDTVAPPCDECSQPIPNDAGSLFNTFHAQSCSLYVDNSEMRGPLDEAGNPRT